MAKRDDAPSSEKEEPQPVEIRPPLDPNSILDLVQPVDPSQPVVSHLDISRLPKWGTQEVAEIFFQRSAGWLRWNDRRGLLYEDALGRKVIPHRIGGHKNGIKRYSLIDIEMMARILYQNGVIEASRLVIVLQMVQLIAIGYNAIPVS